MMGGRGILRMGLMLGLAIALGACVESGAPSSRPPAPGADPGEVEAPAAFSREEAGLWDGRPSLGGVWVAHPSVKAPRRVIIRNTENGKSVTGALFRREREMPGTRLQVSSDAAQALGMLAGAPARLSVVALEHAAPAAGAAPTTAQAKPAAPAAKAERPPKADAAAGKAAADKATPGKVAADKVTTGKVTTDKAATGKAAADKPASVPEKPRPGAAAAPAKPAAPKPAADPGPAAKTGPLIQLGIFGVETNARNAADRLAREGIAGSVRTHRSGSRTFWSVVAGPAESAADTELLLKKVRALGYSDAYAVTK